MQSVDGVFCSCSRFGVGLLPRLSPLVLVNSRILEFAALAVGGPRGCWMSSVARGCGRLHVIFVKRFSLGAFPELRKATSSFFKSVFRVRVEKPRPPPPPWAALFFFFCFGFFFYCFVGF